MSDPVIRRVRRSIDEAKNRGGMQTGMPKVTIDAGDAERLCILSEGLIKATSEAGWHERQKWDVQAENEALRARETKLVEALEPFAACADELDGSPEDGIEPTDDDEWAKFRLLVSDYRRARAALAAYRKQEWEGGLPPVGAGCEIRYLGKYSNNWMPFRVTAITNDFVVGYIRNDRESAVNHKDPYVKFRPLKSKQERQQEEAER